MRRGLGIGLVGLTLGGLGLLRVFPPASYAFYPECPIFAWTGLLCPGCGATRALAALVAGRPVEALRSNALVVVLLPVLVGYAVAGWPRVPRWLGFGLLALAGLFGIGRNLFAGTI